MIKTKARVCSSVLALVMSQSALAMDITPGPSTSQIIEALGIQSSDVVSISLNGTDSRAYGIADTSKLGIIEDPQSGNNTALLLSNSYPTQGRSYFLISSGDVEDADNANDSNGTSTSLDGINTPGDEGGTDLAQLTLTLRAPADAQCATFDFSFFSDEYNEFVNSNFNDTFLIERGTSNYVINRSGSTLSVAAPNNFAFDTGNNVISVNAAFDTVCSTDNNTVNTPADCSTGTTYDNATIRLRANTPVVGGAEETFIISIMDVGDSVLDSTAFIDKFLWHKTSCSTGAIQIDDTDGDGLLNSWETAGLTVNLPGGGTEFIDLPTMGADPNVKDLFIEVDWMEQAGVISYEPQTEVLDKIRAAYDEIGVRVHIDAGPNSIMNPVSNQTWAAAGITSESNALTYDAILGSGGSDRYNWTEFDAIKAANFRFARQKVFHYAVLGHRSPVFGKAAISRDLNSSDFFVAMGDFFGTVNEQAGAFLHASGHNLALRDGGRDEALFKPHYFSVMNPAYMFDGLIRNGVDGHMGFSVAVGDDLIESQLVETTSGIVMAPGGENYGLKQSCNGGFNFRIVNDASATVDWDCDGTDEDSVAADINASGSDADTLSSYNDLNSMRFSGGFIGEPDAIITLPTTTALDDYNQETTFSTRFPSLYEVSIVMESYPSVSGTFTQRAVIRNRSSQNDTYTLTTSSSLGWADFSGLATSYTIDAGERIEIEFPITIPDGTTLTEVVKLIATSNAQATISDVASTKVAATTATASAGATNFNVLFEDGNPFDVEDSGSWHWALSLMLLIGGVLRNRALKQKIKATGGNS